MDPYASGMFSSNPYAAKTPVTGDLVVVLRGSYHKRGLQLIKPPSRVLNAGEIHELIVTDQPCKPGEIVDPIAYLGFFVVRESGVMVVGDQVTIAGDEIGSVAGFDETHMLNHLNIVIQGERVDGETRGLSLRAPVVSGECI